MVIWIQKSNSFFFLFFFLEEVNFVEKKKRKSLKAFGLEALPLLSSYVFTVGCSSPSNMILKHCLVETCQNKSHVAFSSTPGYSQGTKQTQSNRALCILAQQALIAIGNQCINALMDAIIMRLKRQPLRFIKTQQPLWVGYH